MARGGDPAEDLEIELTPGAPPTPVQGKGTVLHYFPPKVPMSDWDVLENDQQAIVAKGGRILSRARSGVLAPSELREANAPSALSGLCEVKRVGIERQ